MFAKRMNALVRMQLSEGRKFRNMQAKNIAVYFLLRVLLIVGITVLSAGIMYIFQNFMYLNINQNLLLFFVGVTLLISVFGNTNLLMESLYLNKDNFILFAFPARHNEIFLSKLIVFYIKEFVRTLYLLLPVFLGFAFITQSFSVWYVLNTVILVFLLPLVPVLLGALLSIPAMYIKKLLKKYSWLQIIFGLAVLGGIFWFITWLLSTLPEPLRLVALYRSFMDGVNGFIGTTNDWLFVIKDMVNTLFASRTALNYVIMFGTVIALIGLVWTLAMPFYFKLVSHFTEQSGVSKHKAVKTKRLSTFSTCFVKEFRNITRTPGRLFLYLAFLIAFPFLIYVMNTIFSKINTNPLGDTLIIVFNLVIGLLLATASNTISATAISVEGEEFALLKTAPSQTYKVAWAKITFNMIISTIGVLLGCLTYALITQVDVWSAIGFTFVMLLFNTAHIFWSFQLDILNPRLNEFAQTGNANDSPNIGRSLLAGVLIAICVGVFAAFFMLDDLAGGWIRLIAVAVVFFAIRLFLFMANLKVYFKRIEL